MLTVLNQLRPLYKLTNVLPRDTITILLNKVFHILLRYTTCRLLSDHQNVGG